MKLAYALIALSLFSAKSFAQEKMFEAKPYQILKEAYGKAPRAPTLEEIPWVKDVSKHWQGCALYDSRGYGYSNITVFKWTWKALKENGPLLQHPQELKVSLVIYEDKDQLNTDSNDNFFSSPVPLWVSKKEMMIYDPADGGPKIKSTNIKSDGQYLYVQMVDAARNPNPYYGYCWK